MENKSNTRNHTTSHDFFDLPDIDSPISIKSEGSGRIGKPSKLMIKSKRDNFTKNILKSAPLFLSESGIIAKKFKISDYYTICERLGIGTYGEVRLAYDIKTDQKVAIKIAKGSTSIQTLKNEVEILKELDSVYFPKYIDYHIDVRQNRAYLVMEYLEGTTLDRVIDEEENPFENNTSDIIYKLAQAVQVLHQKRICHRDLKPENVMITTSGDIKVFDFNISKRGGKSVESAGSKTSSKFYGKFFTQICSPLYSAPEIKSKDCYSESVDIWGIGVISFCLLFGRSHFQDFRMSKSIELEAVESRISDSNHNHIDIILSGLSQDPEARPSITELVASLFSTALN